MAYTDRFYSDPFTPKKRSDRGDLLNDLESTFYGGGQVPRPTSTPTPTPKPVSLAMLGQPIGVLSSSQNAASRVSQPFLTPQDVQTLGTRYIGKGGVDRGALYDEQGNVNPLPRGAVGAQGSPVFNRSLAGVQPPRMDHNQAAINFINQSKTAAGIDIPAAPPDQSKPPLQYPTTPGGNINFNVPGGSMQDVLQKVAPPGMDYSASTGQYISSSTPGLVSTVRGQAPVPRKPDEGGYGSAYGY